MAPEQARASTRTHERISSRSVSCVTRRRPGPALSRKEEGLELGRLGTDSRIGPSAEGRSAHFGSSRRRTGPPRPSADGHRAVPVTLPLDPDELGEDATFLGSSASIIGTPDVRPDACQHPSVGSWFRRTTFGLWTNGSNETELVSASRIEPTTSLAVSESDVADSRNGRSKTEALARGEFLASCNRWDRPQGSALRVGAVARSIGSKNASLQPSEVFTAPSRDFAARRTAT
jgi:hypothetical protein